MYMYMYISHCIIYSISDVIVNVDETYIYIDAYYPENNYHNVYYMYI